MPQYADLVAEAAEALAGVRLHRVQLAPRTCGVLPGGAWSAHAAIVWNAARRLRGRNGLFHVMDGSHAYAAHWLPPLRTVITAHDVIPLLQRRGDFNAPRPGVLAGRLMDASLARVRSAAAVVAVSERTRQDLTEFGVSSDRVSVAMPPLPYWAREQAVRPMRLPSLPREKRFILHVGNSGFYKNRAGVLHVVARIRAAGEDVSLTLVGPALSKESRSLAAELGIAAHIHSKPLVDPQKLATLYAGASIFLFPSLYEGFGWPPLEAMACGCPVVCSNAGSLPEVVGDSALTAGPDDYETLTTHCLRVLREPKFAEELQIRGRTHARKFSFERFRDELSAVYESVGVGLRTRGVR